MMNKPHVTVAYDADFVRELGGGQRAITAALLYNLICLFSNPEEDGWCPITHIVFEARTTLKRQAFQDAQKMLLDGGYIEKQVRLREGTFKKATYFRPLQTGNQSIVCDTDTTMSATQTNEFSVTTPVFKKKVKVNSAIAGNGTANSSTRPATPSSSTRSETCPSDSQTGGEEGDFFSVSEGEQSEPYPMGNPVVVCHKQDEPFDAPVPHVVSLKPTSSMSDEDKQAWAVAGEVTKYCQSKGLKVTNKNVALKSAIKARLKDGATKEDIMRVAEVYCTTNDEFMGPKKKTLHAVFGVENYEKYLNQDFKPKQKPLSYTF